MSGSEKTKRPRRKTQRLPAVSGWLRIAGAVAVAAAAIAVGGLLLSRINERDAPARAAIIDELSLTDPNPAFIDEARQRLAVKGYTVDYFGGRQVTVDLYRGMGTRGYGLILIRGHSAGTNRSVDPQTQAVLHVDNIASLFTSEVYDRRQYANEQRANALDRVHLITGPDTAVTYFGITPDFISTTMRGDLNGAIVALMGCDSLQYEGMARAFVKRGARKVIGWDGLVTQEHMDAASGHLLQYLTDERVSADDAVKMTMSEVGPDPSYGARLVSYP